MKFFLPGILLVVFSVFTEISLAQRGKDNTYTTVSASNTVVNAYTYLTANFTANGTNNTITVNNPTMTSGIWASPAVPLGPGDLILIIQMQGASMDIDVTVSTDPSWGPANYTTPQNHTWDGLWPQYANEWGQILNLNNAGKFEQAEVRSVAGNVITLQCPLQNSYSISGRVQVVRVPRFQDLTINTNASIVPTQWDYTTQTGGIVAIEVNGTLTINSNGRISATGYGFKGGVCTGQVGLTGTNTASTNGAGNGSTFLGSFQSTQGARKGEGIGGSNPDYIALYSEYGRGAPANGGGGGGYQNSGGGGGANVGSGTYTGKGVPNPTFNTAWNLEMAGFGGSSSPGGGRGGYSYSTSDQFASATGPNNTLWGGDARKINGGLGGHAINYDATRLFMGGGGGAGEQDSGEGGAGGNGGGIVMVTCYGTIAGSGIIESEGVAGQNTNPSNQAPSTGDQRKGNDGAGGGGGGGSIYIKNSSAIPGTISLLARGGNGGNVNLTFLNPNATHEGNGPGGGGAGGFIAKTSGTPTQNVSGGTAGTTNSNQLTEMAVNGATNGASGLTNTTTIFNITANNQTICVGAPVTLTVTTTGPMPGTVTWYSSQFGTTVLTTGTSYTPVPAPVVTTTYWVGVCPGTFRIPVTVTVNPNQTSTFNQVAPICSGSTLTLPATSNEGFTGSWSPAPNNTATTLYTFTPTAGQCASTATMTITVNPSNTSTFNQVAPICSGGSFTLPATSNEGYTGTWSPAVNNTATTLYTFTPTAGQCASTATMTVTVNTPVSPSFTQVAPICSGGSFTLPGTSNNSITGTWSPAINNSATTLYTFTPTTGQCASNANMTVTVNPIVTPTFNQVAPICSGGSFTLPSSSNEGITGSWSPAINNTSTTTYTFTPNAGQCANSTTMTVNVGAPTTPTFNQVAPICNGDSFTLPTTSLEAFTGTWSPANNNTATTTYTFTPGAGQCATTATMTVTVNSPVTPTFTQVNPICNGGSFSLPTTSNNGYNGSWSPAINNTITTTYTFTPTAGQCASTASMTVTVNQPAASTFNQIAPICSGDALSMPATSLEGFTGTWSPAVNNTATTSYTFTPNAGQCAQNANMTVTVNSPVTPTFNQVAPICSGGSFVLPATSNEGFTGIWSPAINNTATTTYTFTPAVGQCATTTTMTVTVNTPVTPTFTQWGPFCQNDILVQVMLPSISNEGINGTWNPGMASTSVAGNIVHTFTPNAGECANVTTMTIVVNPQVTPTFNQVAPVCVGGTITLPSTSIEGIAGTWSPAVNNTQTTTYTFTPNAGECATTTTMTVNVGPPQTPTFTQINPICVGGTFTLPNTSLEGFTGTWSPAVNNNATTTYTFTPGAGQCANNATMTVTVNNPVTPTFNSVGPVCSGSTITLPLSSLEGLTGTWTPAVNNTSTTTYTFTPTAGQCANNGTMTVVVNQLPIIDTNSMAITSDHCNQQDGTISGISVSGGNAAYTYEWNNDPALSTLNLIDLGAGTYNLIVSDANGCTDSESVTVPSLSGPVVLNTNLNVVQPTCLQGGEISGLMINGEAPFTYAWTDTTLTTLDMFGLYPGSYQLTVTDNFGCTATYGPIVLNPPAGPTADFSWSPLSPDVNTVVTFTNESTGTASMNYSWSINGQTFNTMDASSSFSQEGSYPVTLTVVDANGCTDMITQNVEIYGLLTIPNVITPNSDNTNDLFVVDGLKPNTSLVVLNRWGDVVFETSNYQNDWDGTDLNGERLLEGVYTYLLTPENDNPKHGFVHLFR